MIKTAKKDEFIDLLYKYRSGLLSSSVFVAKCQEIYYRVLEIPTNQEEIDNILQMPFLHEFFAAEYSDAEIKNMVEYCLKVLEKKQNYTYSCFIQLPIKIDFDDILQIADSEPAQEILSEYIKLQRAFQSEIKEIRCISDCIYMSLRELLANMSVYSHEDNYSYVNVQGTIDSKTTLQRIRRLLLYYAGREPAFVSVMTGPEFAGRIICIG